ncbi:PhzF family phenazine biosynthesis protein [Kovacikia minuta CCNUW1]|uniref:PhzF family phenazine biosynthesis protein n=1 Tax=Kovacikia minuta TaxID=2931930 RepID=UPI001CC8F9CB|nr:PhzF family phenazine biosynthesis protein [Kovacikia minuta]UBF24369.1 PhzF family phenazine biosynthesis protein [Kovacikia minuta CCNUW1]
MPPLSFYIVDVFAETKYAGNPLAVFTDAGRLATEQMQQIAKEINFSETTFILSSEEQNGGYDVRIFTPVKELPFAGHPTLGTAFILQQEVIRQPVERVALNLKVGQIPVNFLYQDQTPDVLWMQQNPPEFGSVLSVDQLAPVLGLDSSDFDTRFPIQEVSTGVPFIIVPLKTLAGLQRIKINLDRLFPLVEKLQAKEIFVFCPETRNSANQFSARMFAHSLGIPEDPATGSANGCFAGYLMHYGYLGEAPLEARVEQGHEIGRPSLLLLKAQKVEEKINIFVGGKVIKIACGKFV